MMKWVMHVNSEISFGMNSVLWIVKFSNVSQNIKLTPKTMNSEMMNSDWWIVNYRSLEINVDVENYGLLQP